MYGCSPGLSSRPAATRGFLPGFGQWVVVQPLINSGDTETPPVRGWMQETYTDIRHWSVLPKGGHFAAFEQPALFVGDVRAFFRPLRRP